MTDLGDAAPGLDVEIERHGGSTTVVTFSGEIDIFTGQRMNEVFQSPAVASATTLRVDLSQVTFLESVGIGILVATCRRVRNEEGAFSVTCGEGMVRRVLELSGLIEYLQVPPLR